MKVYYIFAFTVPSLKLLLNKLHPVRASWYVFGLQLDIPHTELDCIERKHSNQVNLLCEVLKYWFKTAVDPRPTWEAVVTALRSCTVNERFVAHQLELEYCTQHKTDDSNTPTIADRTQGKVAAWHVFFHCLYYIRVTLYNLWYFTQLSQHTCMKLKVS